MEPTPSQEPIEPDEELIKLLKDLAPIRVEYPARLLHARREAFLERVEELGTADPVEELSAEEQELVDRLTPLKSASIDYPADLLAARRSAFLHRLGRAEETSVWEKLRASFQRVFPASPPAGLRRISLVVASLLITIAALVGSFLLPRTERSLPLAAIGRQPLRTGTSDMAMIICGPDDQTPDCLPLELHALRDLADPEDGPAQPAVSRDAHTSADGVHSAAYVNDGHSGASWVSAGTGSWIKIDLGQVTSINTVSLQKGSPEPSQDDDPGQFAIAVALSDEYADGDSSNDEMEYTQVFDSAQASFSGTISDMETIQTRFALVPARFVKVTFEKAGTAIEEVDVFMVPPPLLEAQPTRTPQVSLSGDTLTPIQTSTGLAANPATPAPAGTGLPTDSSVPNATDTSIPVLTSTPPPASDTPVPLPTESSTPVPVPTQPPPSDTPIPLPTFAPPTMVPPTGIPPILDTIVVTGNNQTLTFTCTGNAAVIRGHANTVTLLGSCSSITVTGNRNQVIWESGSPVITDRGNDNVISQL